MTWFRRRLRVELEQSRQLVEDLRKQTWTLSHAVLRVQSEKDLIRQAKEKAEADAAYWKSRAEKFLDQIGLRSGIIQTPTMTEPEAPAGSTVDTVFSALGRSEINHDKSPAPVAAPAATQLTGVDPAAAQAAIDSVLEPLRAVSA